MSGTCRIMKPARRRIADILKPPGFDMPPVPEAIVRRSRHWPDWVRKTCAQKGVRARAFRSPEGRKRKPDRREHAGRNARKPSRSARPGSGSICSGGYRSGLRNA